MAFAQLAYRESLRDIECCLRAMRGKLYHMGIRGKVSRSTIAHANRIETGASIAILPKFLSIRPGSFTQKMISVFSFKKRYMH
jgi:hypothetical protein